MENLRVGRGAKHEARHRIDELAFGRRSASSAAPVIPRTSHRSGEAGPATPSEWSATASIRPAFPISLTYRARRRPANPTLVILGIGLVAELVVPWAVIWLSDMFVFDIPDWSRWLVFGSPLALSLVAVLTYRAFRALSKRSVRR